jgi:ribonuclease VapC
MVIDSSALVAMLLKEPERDAFVEAIRLAPLRLLAAPTAVEAGIVVLSRLGEAGLTDLEALYDETRIEVVPLAQRHVALAIEAFRRFGRGRDPAGLNFGDCFSYALAVATGEPLLFKGNDFARTDVKRAA